MNERKGAKGCERVEGGKQTRPTTTAQTHKLGWRPAIGSVAEGGTRNYEHTFGGNSHVFLETFLGMSGAASGPSAHGGMARPRTRGCHGQGPRMAHADTVSLRLSVLCHFVQPTNGKTHTQIALVANANCVWGCLPRCHFCATWREGTAMALEIAPSPFVD